MLNEHLNFKKGIVFLFLAIYIAPYIFVQFHPTLDGSAHVYNSILLKKIMMNNVFIKSLIEINQLIIPNILGHLIMVILSFLMPSIYIEKVFQVLLVVITWHSFYQLIKINNPKSFILSIVILPFTYSFLLVLGFYNFLIGVPLLFYGLSVFMSLDNNSFFKKYLLVLLFVFLSFFSHLFLALSFILIQFLLILLDCEFRNKISIKSIILINLLPLFLIFNFLYSTYQTNKTYSYIKISELYEWIFNLRSLITFNPDYELAYTRILFVSIITLTITLFSNHLFNYTSFLKILSKLKWFIISLIYLIFLLILPDSDQISGFYSQRIIYFFFICLIIFISSYNWNQPIQFIFILIVLVSSIRLYKDYRFTEDLSSLAKEISKASEFIDNNSFVHTLNYSENWMHIHFSNYIGLNKDVIIDENYEANQSYFPLKWKSNINKINLSCDNISIIPNCHNYLFVLKGKDELTDKCLHQINLIINPSISILVNTPRILLLQIN